MGPSAIVKYYDLVTTVSAAYFRGAYFKYSTATSSHSSFRNVFWEWTV